MIHVESCGECDRAESVLIVGAESGGIKVTTCAGVKVEMGRTGADARAPARV
jgi:hypothetical protein